MLELRYASSSSIINFLFHNAPLDVIIWGTYHMFGPSQPLQPREYSSPYSFPLYMYRMSGPSHSYTMRTHQLLEMVHVSELFVSTGLIKFLYSCSFMDLGTKLDPNNAKGVRQDFGTSLTCNIYIHLATFAYIIYLYTNSN